MQGALGYNGQDDTAPQLRDLRGGNASFEGEEACNVGDDLWELNWRGHFLVRMNVGRGKGRSNELKRERERESDGVSGGCENKGGFN